jgi:hypothetical protein
VLSRAVKRRRAERKRRRRVHRRRERSSSKIRAAYTRGYEDGLRNARDAREALLQEVLPLDVLIPDLTPEEAMAAGVAALRVRGYPVHWGRGVYEEMERALRDRKPFSFIRLGDGELLTLAQEKVLTDSEILHVGGYLPKAGVKIPDLGARDQLLQAVKTASLVGVPMSRMPYFQPLFLRVIRAYGIDIGSLLLTTSMMNFTLDDDGYFMKLLQGRKILIIGDLAEPLAAVLARRGVRITGTVSPVRGFKDVSWVLGEAVKHDFDIALVPAGIAAVPICTRLAEMTGKVTMDFGSLANRITGIPTSL